MKTVPDTFSTGPQISESDMQLGYPNRRQCARLGRRADPAGPPRGRGGEDMIKEAKEKFMRFSRRTKKWTLTLRIPFAKNRK